MKCLALLLLSACCAFGQLTTQTMQPFFNGAGTVSSIPDPSTIAGIRFWWHSADMTTNAAVTNWIDRIQGSIWTNGAPTLQPTNSALGVGFVGTTFLTNTAPFSVVTDTVNAKTGSVVMVVAPVTPAGAIGALIATASVGGKGSYISNANVERNFQQCANGDACAWPTASLKDFYIVITNCASGQDLFYTNSVFTGTSAGAGWGEDAAVKFMFKDGTGGGNFGKGLIRDLIIYYGKLSTADITAIHKWSTNTYSYTP